jgi:hypothetical protein
MDVRIQQRLDEVMGPVKKARISPSTKEVSGTSQWLLVFSALLAFRIINALTIKTFFQPDEYFQALEPAWKIAFGADSGAWITWVSSIQDPMHQAGPNLVIRNGEKACAQRYTRGYSPLCTSSPMQCRHLKVPLAPPERRTCSLRLKLLKRSLPPCWTSTPGS